MHRFFIHCRPVLLLLAFAGWVNTTAETAPLQATPADSALHAHSLRAPAKKEIARKLISAAENSTLDWKNQYGFIKYNVEGNAPENRGYTAGIIGFTSRTHDMLALVEHYQRTAPNNPLTPYLATLRKVNGTSSREGLGQPFEKAWKEAAKDPLFLAAQDHECDRLYFEPAVSRAQADGLRELGQFAYYDAMVMHGPDDDASSFGGIRAEAIKRAKPPAQGGNEAAYLSAFLDARKAAMKTEMGHQDTTRVDTMQRAFLMAGNLSLQLPLVFKVYRDAYEIKALPPESTPLRAS